MCIEYSHTHRAVQALGYTPVPALMEWTLSCPGGYEVRGQCGRDVVAEADFQGGLPRSRLSSIPSRTFKSLPHVVQVPGLGSFSMWVFDR